MKATSDLVRYLNFKLAALGQPLSAGAAGSELVEIARPLLRNFEIRDRLSGNHHCPVDARIQAFLDDDLGPACPHGISRLPGRTLVLDRPGLARRTSPEYLKELVGTTGADPSLCQPEITNA